MAAFILSVAGSIVIGAAVWLLVGPRINYSEDPVQNQVLNLVTFVGIALVILFPIVVLFISDSFL